MFVLLDPPRAVLERRLDRRSDHFTPPSLLASQLATLERPMPDEHALTLAQDDGPDAAVEEIARWLAARGIAG